MTRGALIFAFNNEHIDYVSMANWSAKNIHRHLDIPVCLVTDSENIPENSNFDRVIHASANGNHWRYFRDFDTTATWYNGNRVDAYNLSPWDHTLVLDADYVVASDQLSCLFDVDQDFLAPRWAYEVTGTGDFAHNNFFGKNKMPMSWATIMMFKRSRRAELLFGAMQMIKENWTHYKELYGLEKYTYRNDISLSIAMSILDGHTLTFPSVPWQLASVNPENPITQLSEDSYRVDFLTQDKKPRWIVLNQDFHALGKKHLGAIVANNT